jgi:hypothetical protein
MLFNTPTVPFTAGMATSSRCFTTKVTGLVAASGMTRRATTQDIPRNVSHAIHAFDSFVERAFLWGLSCQPHARSKAAYLGDFPHDDILELPLLVLEQVGQVLPLAAVADGASDIVALLKILSNDVAAGISNEIWLLSLTLRCIRTPRSQGF